MEGEKESGKQIKKKLYAIKVSAGHEKEIALIASERYNNLKEKTSVASELVLDEIKSYILVEADNPADPLPLFYGLKHVRGHVRGMMDIKDIEHLILPKAKPTEIEVGYEVEITWGPFKGNIGEIIGVDKTKNEVKVVLKDSITPLTIQLSADYVKIIKK
ncbi:MAG: transcription elongation factor Spt5 [Thermoproteota archaeon]|jgi:transcriptional antiterminator NusG